MHKRHWVLTAALLVAVAFGVVIGLVWRPFGQSVAPKPTTMRDAFAVNAGECLVSFPDAWQTEYDTTSCDAPHAARVLGTVPVADVLSEDVSATASWPGDARLASLANLACQNLADGSGGLEVQVRWPLAENWAAGVRQYVCFAVLPVPQTTSAATGAGEQ